MITCRDGYDGESVANINAKKSDTQVSIHRMSQVRFLSSRKEQTGSVFFALLRAALTGECFSATPTDEEWRAIFSQVQKQSVAGVVWPVVKGKTLPLDVAFQWVGIAERIRGLNELQNKEAAGLTRLFDEKGRKSVILKGQANARLYPEKDLRQPGDIDIYVEGGQECVTQLLIELGQLDECPTVANVGKKDKATSNYHHIHLSPTKDGVEVEVHFRPSSGNHCPWTNRRLQKWLEREALSVAKVEEGFNVPSLRFALVMQLSHIQRHFLSSGVGIRQICDYYWLLRNSTEEDRREVSRVLVRFGLRKTAGALMWVLRDVLHLDAGLSLCVADEWRGEWMLREIMAGGNFGYYTERSQGCRWQRFFAIKTRHIKLLRFNFWEVVWQEVDYLKVIVITLPERIRRRSLFLGIG